MEKVCQQENNHAYCMTRLTLSPGRESLHVHCTINLHLNRVFNSFPTIIINTSGFDSAMLNSLPHVHISSTISVSLDPYITQPNDVGIVFLSVIYTRLYCITSREFISTFGSVSCMCHQFDFWLCTITNSCRPMKLVKHP